MHKAMNHKGLKPLIIRLRDGSPPTRQRASRHPQNKAHQALSRWGAELIPVPLWVRFDPLRGDKSRGRGANKGQAQSVPAGAVGAGGPGGCAQ